MKRFSLIFQFLIAAVSVHWVSAQRASADPGAAIGVILPLTGPVAEYGVAAKNGIEFARQLHPEIVQNINFIFEDSRYEGATALMAFEKLRADSTVKLIYVWGYGPNQAVAPVAESRKFPIFAVSRERGISKDRKFVVRFCYYNEQVADVLHQYWRDNGWKHLGLIKTELAYNNSVFDALKSRLKPDESLDLVDTYEMGQNDFRASLLRVRGRNYDAFGAFLVGPQVSQFYRQLAELNIKVKTFGTDFLEGTEEVRKSGPAIAGAVFAGQYVDPDFVQQYTARFGSDSDISWAANSFEFALLAGRALGKPRDPKSPEADEPILLRFRGLGRQLGVTGPYEYGEGENGAAFEFSVVPKRISEKLTVENIPVIPPDQTIKPEPLHTGEPK